MERILFCRWEKRREGERENRSERGEIRMLNGKEKKSLDFAQFGFNLI